jgi:hypothetical protein
MPAAGGGFAVCVGWGGGRGNTISGGSNAQDVLQGGRSTGAVSGLLVTLGSLYTVAKPE